MPETSTDSATESVPASTIAELIALCKQTAKKEDMEEIKTQIKEYKEETDKKMNSMKKEIKIVSSSNTRNAERIDCLQATIETLKQDQLQNNLCISGVPIEIVNKLDTATIISNIASALGITIDKSQSSSYAVANKKFVIVKFFNLKYKQMLISKMRSKKSLMVEEVFKTKSNSQIYLNDHLTQYFNKLYLTARTAKKEGKLVSATSYNGKIRVRKNSNDVPILITSESQLLEIIEMEISNDLSNDSVQLVSDDMNISSSTTATTSKDTSTSNASNTSYQKPNRESKQPHQATKRKAADRTTTNSKKPKSKQN